MEKYKVKDLVILRPMKLLEHTKKVAIPFPGNVISKLQFLSKNPWMNIFDDHSQFKILRLPDKYYKEAVEKEKEVFVCHADDTTIGIKTEDNEYEDIFTHVKYKGHTPNAHYEAGHYEDAIIGKIINTYLTESLFEYFFTLKCRAEGREAINSFTEFLNETNEKEFTVDELYDIRSQIATEFEDTRFTFKRNSNVPLEAKRKQKQYTKKR